MFDIDEVKQQLKEPCGIEVLKEYENILVHQIENMPQKYQKVCMYNSLLRLRNVQFMSENTQQQVQHSWINEGIYTDNIVVQCQTNCFVDANDELFKNLSNIIVLELILDELSLTDLEFSFVSSEVGNYISRVIIRGIMQQNEIDYIEDEKCTLGLVFQLSQHPNDYIKVNDTDITMIRESVIKFYEKKLKTLQKRTIQPILDDLCMSKSLYKQFRQYLGTKQRKALQKIISAYVDDCIKDGSAYDICSFYELQYYLTPSQKRNILEKIIDEKLEQQILEDIVSNCIDIVCIDIEFQINQEKRSICLSFFEDLCERQKRWYIQEEIKVMQQGLSVQNTELFYKKFYSYLLEDEKVYLLNRLLVESKK